MPRPRDGCKGLGWIGARGRAPHTSDSWPFRKQPCSLGSCHKVLTWRAVASLMSHERWTAVHLGVLLSPLPGSSRARPSRGCREHSQQASPCNGTPCLCLLCFAPQVPLPPDSRCCYCHTCTTHRPSYLPLPSVSPGVKVFTPPAVCVSVFPKRL